MLNSKRNWNQERRKAGMVCNGSEKLLARVDARAAELEDRIAFNSLWLLMTLRPLCLSSATV